MSKKKTIEEVREFIEGQGYKLISDVYVNSKTKLKMECDKGHEFDMSYGDFKQNHRCPYCSGKHKYTLEEIKKIIENIGYTLLSNEYINNSSPLLVRCDKGHKYTTNFKNLSKNNKCPYCSKTKKKTYNEVKIYIESQGYKLISDKYINSNTKLKMRCPEGHKFEMDYRHFYNRKQRCPICFGKKKKTIEEVEEYIESQGYKLLSDTYVNNQNKLFMMCPQGHKFDMRFDCFKNQGQRCPECMKKVVTDKNRTPYEVVKKVLKDSGFELLSDTYIRLDAPITVKCSQGHIYETSYHSIKSGNGCPYCYGNKKKTIEEVRKHIELIEGYKLLSTEYVNSKTKLKIECNKGHQFETSWNSFSHMNTRCPVCNLSKGEEKVRNILEDYKIDYKTQYKFDNCRNKNPLPFDFYLPELNICVEYDGIQHFKPINFKGRIGNERSLENFKYTQQNDQIKTDYCRQNRIKLIRIPYTEFDNIEDILIKELNLKKIV